MPDLEVDVEGLERLVSSLAAIKDGLDHTRRVVDGTAADMGSADVARALDRFEDHWDDGRGRVSANIEGIVGGLQEAARAYRQADDDLASGLREGS